MTLSKWIRFQEGKNNKYKLSEKDSEYSELKRLFVKNKFSECFLSFCKVHGGSVINNLKNIRKYVRKLVYIRNKILQTLRALYNTFEDNNEPYTKSDHMMLMTEFSTYLMTGIDKFDIWKIKKKTKEEYTSEIELSE
mmetsp:Transcript_6840/g.5990  ORF Transcript_6840/g.5990 Transcript_6840/m.5990 type:complete len:137 (+) Transcript_6840:490-900(+)